MKLLLLTVLLPLVILSVSVPKEQQDLLVKIKQDVVQKVAKHRIEAIMQKIKQDVVQKVAKHRIEAMMQMAKNRQTLNQVLGIRFLCKPCKTLFADVKQELQDVEKITAEELKASISKACDKYVGKLPFIDQACKKIGDEAIDDLVDWLNQEEEKIVPERVCTYLHMC